MVERSATGMTAAAMACALMAMAAGSVQADDTKYPDWRGQWNRRVVPGLGGQPSFDQTRPWGRGQRAPLTPEYAAVLEASLAEQANGGQGNFVGHSQCVQSGMPLMMIAFVPQEYVVTPDTTYINTNTLDNVRRVYTDGRDWPTGWMEPTYQGYSIGKWIDEDGDGRYDMLEVETRGPFKGPRAYDATGLPLHFDNQSIFKERIYLDKANPNILHDEITVIDHALTRPWTVDKQFIRSSDARPVWSEGGCQEGNLHVQVGPENYFVSGDGFLMPARKNQAPPDLRYFTGTRKTAGSAEGAAK